MRTLSILSGVSSGAIALLSAFLVPEAAGRTSVKLILAVQFVLIMGSFIWTLLSSPVLAAKFGFNTLIYWMYAPGFILYALKWPKRDDFGYHEAFHTSVLGGHLSSMILDLRHILLRI